ncbi:hypothetical protein FRC17_001708, partial [Serendipita sp. 399]
MAYDPNHPHYAQQQHQQPHFPQPYATQPVNFNDTNDDFFQGQPGATAANPNNLQDDGRKTYNDRSSVMTGWTSGVTVPYTVPLLESGQTHAQAIASEYSARDSLKGQSSPTTSNNANITNNNAYARPPSAVLSGGGDRKSFGP